MRAHHVDDVGQPVGQPAQCGHEHALQALEVAVEIEPGDDRTRLRIGVGRAIAQEFGQYMEAAREQRRVADRGEAGDGAAFEEIEQPDACLPGGGRGFGIGRMRAHEMIDAGAGGRLATLVQP